MLHPVCAPVAQTPYPDIHMPTLDHAFARIRFAVVFLLVVLMTLVGAAPALAQFDTGHGRRHRPRLVRCRRAGRQGHADQRRDRHLRRRRPPATTATTSSPRSSPGMYVVTAEKTGFALALVDNVQVQVGARLRVDLQMPVGQMTEKVEVTAAQPLLETDSSQRGQVITGEQTRALPLHRRASTRRWRC